MLKPVTTVFADTVDSRSAGLHAHGTSAPTFISSTTAIGAYSAQIHFDS